MAMTLSSMVNIAMFNQGVGVSTSTQGGAAASAFASANLRVQQKLDSTNVQLSAFSQISSGFASVQSASKAMANPASAATSADVVNAVKNFTSAFNTATKAVAAAVNGTSHGNGVLANDIHAHFASNDLKSVLTSGNNTAELNKIGVSLNNDGTLSVNAKTLQAAIQANPNAVNGTLTKIGQQAGQISTKDLASTGNVGGSVNSLSGTTKALQTQSAAQQKLASDSQLATQQQVAKIGNVASGIASYLQILSL